MQQAIIFYTLLHNELLNVKKSLALLTLEKN